MYERKCVGGRAIMSIISRMNEKKQFANENKWFQKDFHAAECLLKTKREGTMDLHLLV